MSEYAITRKEILTAAETCRGWKFLHQGRGENNSVDCVGLLVVIARMINYPNIFDAEGYRRTPSADTIRQTLRLNADEIDLAEMKPADIFLMRLGGIKPRHTAMYFSAETDLGKGREPMILHAANSGVKLEPISNFPVAWFVAGFRLRGILEGE